MSMTSVSAFPRHAAAPAIDRDRGTAERLRSELSGAEMVGFDAHWWDGAAYVPCLRVTVGERRLRLVETQGLVAVLPDQAWRARRALRRWRRGDAPLPVPTPAAAPHPDRIDGVSADTVSCHYAGCGGLLPLDGDGLCPLCHRR